MYIYSLSDSLNSSLNNSDFHIKEGKTLLPCYEINQVTIRKIIVNKTLFVGQQKELFSSWKIFFDEIIEIPALNSIDYIFTPDKKLLLLISSSNQMLKQFTTHLDQLNVDYFIPDTVNLDGTTTENISEIILVDERNVFLNSSLFKDTFSLIFCRKKLEAHSSLVLVPNTVFQSKKNDLLSNENKKDLFITQN